MRMVTLQAVAFECGVAMPGDRSPIQLKPVVDAQLFGQQALESHHEVEIRLPRLVIEVIMAGRGPLAEPERPLRRHGVKIVGRHRSPPRGSFPGPSRWFLSN